MKKNYYYLAFMLSILTLISCSDSCSEPEYNVILLDNNIENKAIDDLSSSIYNDAILKDPAVGQIILNFNSKVKDIDLPAFAATSNHIQIISDSLKKLIAEAKNINSTNLNETANNHIEDLARVLSNITETTSVVIAGKFPICYDKENMNKALSNFKKNLSIKNKDLIEINWMVQSNSEEPENIFYNYLKNSGIKFLDNQITVAKRVCPSSSRKVYSIFFNPIDSSDVQNFEKLLTSNYGKDLKLKIWNDSKVNDSIISTNNGLFKPGDRKLLSELSKGQWTSIGFLIKQATTEFEAMHDTVSKDLMIVAPMPLENRGSVINPEVWTTLSKLKNLNVYFVSSNKSRQNPIDKAIKNGIKKSATKFTELNF